MDEGAALPDEVRVFRALVRFAEQAHLGGWVESVVGTDVAAMFPPSGAFASPHLWICSEVSRNRIRVPM